MSKPFSSYPFDAAGVDNYAHPEFLIFNRKPTIQDIYTPGTRIQDISVSPYVIYETTGAGVWISGGNAYATTTMPGIVTLSSSILGDATSLTLVPTVKEMKDYVDSVAIAGAPDASTGTKGIVYLLTNAEAVAGSAPNANTAVQVSNLAAVLASPSAIGSVSASTGAFTTLAASSTLSVTGASTIAALSATTGAFSSTLSVTGASTIAALSATSGAFSTTLSVTGASTITSLSATTGTFSSTLGVTGASTLSSLSATTGSFSGAVSVAGTLTLAAVNATNATFSGTLGVTGTSTLGALTQVGTANINASGAAATNIGNGGTGTVKIGNATGNTEIVAGNLTATLGNIVASAGNISSTLGSMSAATTVTAGTGITATTGNIVASTGNITTTAGSITSATTLTATSGDITATNGNVLISSTGKGLRVKGGAATDFVGSAILILGTVTVANTNIAAGDRIFLSRISSNGSVTLGELSYTISAGSSFTINSLILGTPASNQTADVSSVAYFIVRPL